MGRGASTRFITSSVSPCFAGLIGLQELCMWSFCVLPPKEKRDQIGIESKRQQLGPCNDSHAPCPCCWQAATLWRCADCFKNGLIKQADFHQLLASLIGPTLKEVRRLAQSKGLIRMMHISKCLQEDGTANIRQFVQHYYQPSDGDLPPEDEKWDLQLFRQLREALLLPIEVGQYI